MDVYWLEQSEADVPLDNTWLSGTEVARLATLRFAKRRTDWRLGRWTAKQAVAAYPQLGFDAGSLSQIEIRPAPSGAPEVLYDNVPAPIAISLSHRCGIAACALGPPGSQLGCDLELVEPRTEAFVADYFTAEERQEVAHASAADRSQCTALLWSAKESALKALGEGLRLDTRSITVTLIDRSPSGESNCWYPLEARTREGRIFLGWWKSAEGLVRTIVADPAPLTPRELTLLARHT